MPKVKIAILALIVMLFGITSYYLYSLYTESSKPVADVKSSQEIPTPAAVKLIGDQATTSTKPISNLDDQTASATTTLKLLFFGDLMADRQVKIELKKHGWKEIIGELKATGIFEGQDLVMANLEGAVTDEGQHFSPQLANDFAFDPKTIAELKEYNFNFFSLANNHLSDQGLLGVKQTEINLAKNNFNFIGCTDSRVNSCSAKIVTLNDVPVGLAAFSLVYKPIDEELALAKIKDLKANSSLVIINLHWGSEYQNQFNKKQQQLAHALIDAGADIIIGHHPHVVQGVEIYHNRPIFYSLGNFVFDQYQSQLTQQGLAVKIAADFTDKKINKLTFSLIPLESRSSQVNVMSENKLEKFWQELLKVSQLENSPLKLNQPWSIIVL